MRVYHKFINLLRNQFKVSFRIIPLSYATYSPWTDHIIELKTRHEPESVPRFSGSASSYQSGAAAVAVMQYQAGNVVPQLLENLGSPAREIIYWNVQLAANFSTERLIASLTILVRSADEDLLAASLIAVRQIKSPRVPALLEPLSCFPLTDEIRAFVANHIDNQRQD